MAAAAKRIEIGVEDRRELERVVRSRKAERRLVERARIVLAAGEGRSAARIAGEVGCSQRTVMKWRRRFEADGVAGLRDAPRPGRPLVHGPHVRARLIALACTRPRETPEGLRRERWTHRELAEQVGMSESQAHEILRAAEIKPHLLEQWVMSELGPDFDAQAAEVCGLYLDPPEGTRGSSRSTRRPASRPRRQPTGRASTTGEAEPSRARIHPQRHPKPVRRAARAQRRGERDACQDAQPLRPAPLPRPARSRDPRLARK